jgi:hypothetical protein
LATIRVVALVALQLTYIWCKDAFFLTADLTVVPAFQIAMMAKEKTPADSALVVLGDDWSSEIPYYAERKAVTPPY